MAPNPALPTDQPLRGSWRNADVVLLQTRINHANRCAEFGSMQMLFLLQTRINHANCYAVVGAIQMLFLLPTRINHSNCYAVVGAISGAYILLLLKTYGFLS